MVDNLQEDVNNGYAARSLLDHELLQGAFAHIEQTHISGWRNGRTKETREDHWQGLQALEKLRSRLQKYIDDGKMAQMIVDQQIDAEKRIRRASNG